jgi:hypothetical protein
VTLVDLVAVLVEVVVAIAVEVLVTVAVKDIVCFTVVVVVDVTVVSTTSLPWAWAIEPKQKMSARTNEKRILNIP